MYRCLCVMYGISFSKDIIDSDNYFIALFITVGLSIPTVHLQRHSTYQAIYIYIYLLVRYL